MALMTVPETDHNAKSGLVVKNSGFSLHAGVAVKAHERDRLERICRYIARRAVIWNAEECQIEFFIDIRCRQAKKRLNC